MPVLEDDFQNNGNEQNGRFPNNIAHSWQKLTTPVAGLSPDENYHARITVTLTLLFIPFVIVQVIVQLMNQENYTLLGVLSLLGFLLTTVALHVVSRTKFYWLAAIAICIITAVYPFSRIIARNDFSDAFITFALSWLILSIILATVLLPVRQATIFATIVIIAMIFVPMFIFEVTTSAVIRAVSLVAVSSTLLLLYRYYRTKIDNERISQLAQANAELQKSKEEQAKLYLQATQNEATLDLIFEKAPIGMMVNNEDGQLLRANQAFCELVGYSESELKTKSYADFTHPDDIHKNLAYGEQLRLGEIDQFQMEKRYMHRNGDVITVFLQVARLQRDEEGHSREVAQVVNISKRKKMEEELLAQQHLLQGIIDNNSSLIYVKDMNGRYLMANKAYYAFLGKTESELLSQTDHMLFPKEIADTFFENDQMVLAAGTAVQIEEVVNEPDGLHTYLSVKFPLYDQDGKSHAIAGISTDITTRKKNEEALLHTTRQLQTIRQMGLELTSQLDFETLAELIITKVALLVNGDIGGIYIHLPATQELKIVATNSHHRLPAGATIPDTEGVAGHVWTTGKAIIIENYSEWNGRSANWVDVIGERSIMSVPIVWQEQKQGVINIVAATNTAFTQDDADVLLLFAANAAIALYNAKLHEELQKHTKELERSNRELKLFAYAASHDLQEPLRKIRTFSDRLQTRFEGQLDDRGQTYLTRMETAAARMQTLIEALLSFSRVTTDSNSYKPTNLNNVLQESLEDLETKIEETGAQITIDESLPIIEADPTQIRQLFQNLISNALKFQPPQGTPQITISARLLPDEQYPNFCEIDICDNGIGIEAEYESRIFGMFQRLHSRQQFDGTGLGLAICQRIVERHHGMILVQSQLGEGSQFTIQLPLKQPI